METKERVLAYAPSVSELSELGFDERLGGAHTSRTLMLAELELALSSLPAGSGALSFKKAIIEGNVLGKSTHAAKKNVAYRLVNLYGFDPSKPLYAAFEALWAETSTARPVLAILLAQCRDVALRVTAPIILETPMGGTVTKDLFYPTLLERLASRFGEKTLRSTAKNVASSWKQSGHLVKTSHLIRTKAPSDFHALAFAILIGYLRGLRGQALLASDWIRILDFEPAELEMNLSQAHRHGLITSRKIGEVIDLSPGPDLIPGGEA